MANIKKCRFCNCQFPNKEIHIDKDEYVAKGRMYYHSSCYKKKNDGEWKSEATKRDLQYIKNLWCERISRTVNYGELFKILNEYISRGVKSEYLVFVLEYCISHKKPLNYPAGFRYYVDFQEIKDAYARKKSAELKKKMAKEVEEMKKEMTGEHLPVGEKEIVEPIKPTKHKGFGDLFG